jgi:hypothetical protein
MKKKTIIILIGLIIVFLGIYFILNTFSTKEKIYLSDKYYNTIDKYVDIDSEDIINLNNDNYLLFIYNNFCIFSVPCDVIFEEFMEKYNISILHITFDEFKKTNYYKKIKFAPSIAIINNGKIIDYLKADSDDDVIKYQDVDEFEKWLDKYIYFTNKKS